MLVRANEMGYAGKDGHSLRQPGDVFEMEDEMARKSLSRPHGTWFVPVPTLETEKTKRKTDTEALV